MPRDRLSFLLDLSPSTTNQTPRKSVSYSRMTMTPNHLRPLETVSVERAFAWTFAHLWAFDRTIFPICLMGFCDVSGNVGCERDRLPPFTLPRRHRQTFLRVGESWLELERPPEAIAGSRPVSQAKIRPA